MPSKSHLLEHGDSETEPVSVCVRATGGSPGGALRNLLSDVGIPWAARVEQVDVGHFRLILMEPDADTGDYVNVYVNLNNLGPCHIVEGETDELEDDGTPEWNATYTSVWDDGTTVTTNCVYDPSENGGLGEVEAVDVDVDGTCVREYVTFEEVEYEVNRGI